MSEAEVTPTPVQPAPEVLPDGKKVISSNDMKVAYAVGLSKDGEFIFDVFLTLDSFNC